MMTITIENKEQLAGTKFETQWKEIIINGVEYVAKDKTDVLFVIAESFGLTIEEITVSEN